MRPVRLVHPRGKTLAIRHRCTSCGHEQVNKLALDDLRQPDRYDTVVAIQQQQARR